MQTDIAQDSPYRYQMSCVMISHEVTAQSLNRESDVVLLRGIIS